MNIKLGNFIMINLGLLIMAAGLHFFLVPANLAVGGVTGLSMVIQHYFPFMNLGVLMAIFNIILFILAFILIGREFVGLTIYCSLLLSGLMGLFEIVLPLPKALVDDLMLNLVFGILIQGVGMAVILYRNASTGGTDIVAKLINKYSHIDIGKSLFLADSAITLLAGLTFGVELGLYAFLGILINGYVIDNVIAGFNTKMHVTIVSKQPGLINEFIQKELCRGTTYIFGAGGFSGEQKDIISVVLSRREYLKMKNFIKENDCDAFVTMNFAHEVFGEGFDLALQQ